MSSSVLLAVAVTAVLTAAVCTALGVFLGYVAAQHRRQARPAGGIAADTAGRATDSTGNTDSTESAASAGTAGGSEFDSLVAQVNDAVLVVDVADRIRYASPSARSVFGTAALVDIPLPDLIDPAQRRAAAFLLQHAREMAAGGDSAEAGRADWTVYARDGRTVQAEVSCRPLRRGDSSVEVAVVLRDVTVQRQLEQELTRRTFRDPLTGLPNRALFGERLQHAMATGTGETGVILVDVAHFKLINESLGHGTGDAVLTTVADRLRELAGEDGVVGRLGDDEFGLLLADATVAQVRDAASRILRVLVAPMPLAEGAVTVSVHVGVATSASAATAPELLRHADQALDAAQSAGPGQWRLYDPAALDPATDRATLRSELADALRDDTLRLLYQPIVALDTGQVVGFEALLRWQHPTRGQLGPADFLPVAEESGLIVPIGEWVLATAVAAARDWPADADGSPYVTVNVSAYQFRSAGFLDTVRRHLTGSGLPPERLVLEITESSLLADDETVWQDLQRVRQWGVRVAIDDFGTGYSALSYLRHAPLDVVKLDRVFTGSLAASERQREVVAGIVQLARTLRLDVVAEGVETETQREIAIAVGCPHGQGYLFGRPGADPSAFLPAPGVPARER